jgi:hypothetical protein
MDCIALRPRPVYIEYIDLGARLPYVLQSTTAKYTLTINNVVSIEAAVELDGLKTSGL